MNRTWDGAKRRGRLVGALLESQAAGLLLSGAGGEGATFDRWGRRAALRMLVRGDRAGLRWLINPVSSVRYFEFPFVARHLPAVSSTCLDVASPRLFALWARERARVGHVTMLNPDLRDLEETRRAALALGTSGLELSGARIERHTGGPYDCIWSISVVEHVAGDEGDTHAVRRMMGMLRPGGRLVITLPVNRRFQIERRAQDTYGLGGESDAGDQFFQRLYDEEALHERILGPLGVEPQAVEWFGERAAGTFAAYEQRWLQRGLVETAVDAWTFHRAYARFESFSDMPGVGVVGLVLDRPEGWSG